MEEVRIQIMGEFVKEQSRQNEHGVKVSEAGVGVGFKWPARNRDDFGNKIQSSGIMNSIFVKWKVINRYITYKKLRFYSE